MTTGSGKWQLQASKTKVSTLKHFRTHLECTEIILQAVANQDGVSTDEAEQHTLNIPKGEAGTGHILFTYSRKPVDTSLNRSGLIQ